MRLVPNETNPDKWVRYFRTLVKERQSDGGVEASVFAQKGYGTGTLVPRRRMGLYGHRSADDLVHVPAKSTVQAQTDRARSEVRHRQQTKRTPRVGAARVVMTGKGHKRSHSLPSKKSSDKKTHASGHKRKASPNQIKSTQKKKRVSRTPSRSRNNVVQVARRDIFA